MAKWQMDKDARMRLRMAVKIAMNDVKKVPEAVSEALKDVPRGTRHGFLKNELERRARESIRAVRRAQ